jgi:lysylphosphatidylglycerol synthetase-like protein (DUF2156 family)
LFIRYGSAASEAMLDFPCHFFQIPECIGIISYRIESKCAIVFGDPICPPSETTTLVEAFHRFCNESNWNIIYIVVSERFAKNLSGDRCNISLEVCEECIFDPQLDPFQSHHRLRHRVDKALKHGLTIHEYIPHDQDIENSLKQIGIQWRQSIEGPHIYLGHLNFFDNYTGRRWFYTRDGEKITGMIMLCRTDAYEGWLLKFLITSPEAIHETSEFLMTSVLEILKRENCSFLTKGFLPISHLGEVKGLGYFATILSRSIYRTINWFFQFEKHKEYWFRYKPRTAPAYLLFNNKSIGLNEIRALMKTFKIDYTSNS